MRNKDVVKAFIQRKAAKVQNLESTGDKLISYNTVIAQWTYDGELYINSSYYSATTSRHLGYLKRAIPYDTVIWYTVRADYERGTQSLLPNGR
jgi:hypothetical protein